MWFEALSCLKVNVEKSEFIAVGRVDNIEDLTGTFGCRVGALPSTYLSIPLGAPFNSISIWDGVEKRFRKRLALWERQYISKGGQVDLDPEHSFPSAHLFIVSFPYPKGSEVEAGEDSRAFFWDGRALEKKPH